nr:preprotein translocase subunit YajC [Limosilactobacillus albertensis]
MSSFVLGAASSNNASGYSGIILIILMVALMYFFMIRPQQKQRKEHQEMMNELHPGDEVVTIGRMHGKIDSINKADRTVTLDCEGIYLTFDMVAIARVVKRADAPASEAPQNNEADSASSAVDSADAATADSAANETTSAASANDEQKKSEEK